MGVMLQDFVGKNMIEQIGILEDIRLRKLKATVPALFDLYAGFSRDKAVDEIIYHTLFSLLDEEAMLVESGLRHPSGRVRLLAVRKVYERPFPEAMPILGKLLNRETDSQLLGETIRALGRFDDPALVDILLPYLEHDDYSIVGWVLEILQGHADPRISAAVLRETASHQDEATGRPDCDLLLAMLVAALGNYPEDAVIDFLVAHIHHANPTLRRLVISALGKMGKAGLPALERCLESGNKDEKIMAANILGQLGERQAADILVGAFGAGEPDANLRFAIYEALGRINSIRSVIGLSDGLDDTDAFSADRGA